MTARAAECQYRTFRVPPYTGTAHGHLGCNLAVVDDKDSAAATHHGAAQNRQTEVERAWGQLARKGANSGSQGMAHALREGPWKLVLDIERDKPAALYNLAEDLAEQKNLIEKFPEKARDLLDLPTTTARN